MKQLPLEGVCICIPTKDRPEMVRDVLEHTRTYYPDYGLKVIYYDSSEGDETKKIIEAQQTLGYSNLFWKRENPSWSMERKLFEFLKGDEDIYNADYVWLINDSIAILKEALDEVAKVVPQKYDLIRFPFYRSEREDDYICYDIDQWFQNSSRGITHVASTIMSTILLRADPDWDDLYRKYIATETIDDGKHQYFYHVGLYFEQIAKLGHFSGFMFGCLPWRWDSVYKKKIGSYWYNFDIDVWVRSYCETILQLPDCYTNKEKVIRSSANICIGRFERESMIKRRREGSLTKEIVFKYRKYWGMVSTLSFEEILRIASASEQDLVIKYGSKLSWAKDVDRIEEQLGGRPIIIYGAAARGTFVLKKLLQDGFADKILGVAVTDPSVNFSSCEGYPIRGIEDYISVKDDADVLVSTMPDVALEIDELLRKMEFKNRHLVFKS